MLLEWPQRLQNFWDLASPEAAADLMTELYGAAAATAAVDCAFAALADNRNEDYRFWAAVFSKVRSPGNGRFTPALSGPMTEPEALT